MSGAKTFRKFLTLADRRRLALKHHARLSVECLHPRFRWLEYPYSIVLSVNSGYE